MSSSSSATQALSLPAPISILDNRWVQLALGVGSILGGPLAAWMHESTGSWTVVFVVVITLDFITAFLAIAVLKPMRGKFLAAKA